MTKAEPKDVLMEGAAATWLAGCAGFAIATFAPAAGVTDTMPWVLGGMAFSALGAHRILLAGRQKNAVLQPFDLVAVDPVEPEIAFEPLSCLELTTDMQVLPELLLTAEMACRELELTAEMELLRAELMDTFGQMFETREPPASDALLLEDALPALQPDSRVVHLFAPNQAPTPGDLKKRIDGHLRQASEGAAGEEPQGDASQALNDALAALRRSLG